MEQQNLAAGGQTATLVRPSAMGGDGASADVSFLNSTSRAQGFHPPPSRDEHLRKSDGPIFKKSQFEPQAIVEAEKTRDERKGVVWRFKNAFLKSENQISTWMTLGFIKAWVDKTFGAWGKASPLNAFSEKSGLAGFLQNLPKPPGHGAMTALLYGKEFDKNKLESSASTPPETTLEKLYAIGVTTGLLQNLSFFMTARGGEVPEGDTMGQRALNALKNPDKHAVHFSNVTMGVIVSAIGAARIALGITGLRNTPEKRNEHLYKIVAGLAGVIASPMMTFGMLRIKKGEDSLGGKKDSEGPEKVQERIEQDANRMRSKEGRSDDKSRSGKGLIASLKPGHMKEMWAYALKNDRMGLIGRGLQLVVELGFITEGRMRLAENPQDKGAYATVKGGLTGLVLSCMQIHFVYDRLLNNSKKEHAAPAR